MEKANKNCDKCEYLRLYCVKDFIYYCDNEERKDDMGKIGSRLLPTSRPDWCPKKD